MERRSDSMTGTTPSRGVCVFRALPLLAVLLTAAPLTGCSAQVTTLAPRSGGTEVDSARIVADLRYLSSPELAGRGVGTPGGRAARTYIQRELEKAGVRPFAGGWFQEFIPEAGAANVVGWVEGTEKPDRFIVLSAHYDHLGSRNGLIFPGADDNASGTAALLEIARILAVSPLRHSVIFAAFDAEEGGMIGSSAFVADPPVPVNSLVLNVNMDMISRNRAGEIYVAGPYHFPFLADHVRATASRSAITVRMGHDQPVPASEDWTGQSDHLAFFDRRIPFAYFGVEDHPDYHRPTDTFENTDPGFFVRATATVLDFLKEMDGSSSIR